MSLHKTHGVVLRRRDFGEADRILTVFTRRFGKVKMMAKGCRKPRSRLAGHLEPCQAGEFVFWRREGRDMGIVRSAELLEPHPGLSTDFASFAAAQFAAELVDRSVPEDEPQTRLYSVFLQFLRALRRPDHAYPALLAFTVRAASLLGYGLSAERCTECGERIAAADGAWLDPQAGGLLCEGCSAAAPGTLEPVPTGALRALRSAAANPPRTAPDDDARSAVRVMDSLLAWHQDRSGLASGRLLDTPATDGSGIMGNTT